MHVNNVYGTKMQHFNCRIEQMTLNVIVADVTGRWGAEPTTCHMVWYDNEQSPSWRWSRGVV